MNKSFKLSPAFLTAFAALAITNLSAMNNDIEKGLTFYGKDRTATAMLAQRAKRFTSIALPITGGIAAATMAEALIPTVPSTTPDKFLEQRTDNLMKRDLGITSAVLTGYKALKHSSKMLAAATLAWAGFATKYGVESSEATYENLKRRHDHFLFSKRFANRGQQDHEEQYTIQCHQEIKEKAPSYWDGKLQKFLQEKYEETEKLYSKILNHLKSQQDTLVNSKALKTAHDFAQSAQVNWFVNANKDTEGYKLHVEAPRISSNTPVENQDNSLETENNNEQI